MFLAVFPWLAVDSIDNNIFNNNNNGSELLVSVEKLLLKVRIQCY